MICKVSETVKKYNMLPVGSRVTVALSGGADSMALLHAMLELKDGFSLDVTAAHVNHCLRGEEADRDERFVREQCRALGVELDVLRIDVRAAAAESGEGLEECGRRIRYEFFASLPGERLIATAHNLTDRAETFLFNFTRGAGLRGLGSIPPVRGNVIRPLLACSREEIEKYCSENRIEYVTDSTNLQAEYSRNRIRLKVIPQLRHINPAFEQAALRCIDSLGEDEALLSGMAAELVLKAENDGGFDAEMLASAPAALQRRAAAQIIFEKTNRRPDYKTVCELCGLLRADGQIQTASGAYIRVRQGLVDFPKYSDIAQWRLDADEGELVFPGGEAVIRIINRADTNSIQKVHNQGLEYQLDYDKICGKAVVRNRREGDRIALVGRGCTKTLKKLFNEASIAPEKRAVLLIAADACGPIAVEGFGVAARCAVDSKTKTIISILIRRATF